MRFRDLLSRARAILRRQRVEAELRDELEFHIDMQARKHVLEGMGPAEARRLARAEFGNVERAKEDARDVRRVRIAEELAQDVRYALRSFGRAPTFTTTVILTIALGIGLNTAVFSVINAYVLRPLTVRDPTALYEVTWRDRTGNGHLLSWDSYADLRLHTSVFAETLAERTLFVRVDAQASLGGFVSDNYFQMLGVGPALGRTIEPGDALAPGAGAIAVLSYSAWKARFGGDSTIIGRTIDVRGVALRIVGVAREDFRSLDNRPRDFWAPLSMLPVVNSADDLYSSSHPELLTVIGRLAHGVRLAQAKPSLLAWARALTASQPDSLRAVTVTLDARATPIAWTPAKLAAVSPMLFAFALVLVIACANVANMMLARGMARQREIGIRLSLGAPRARLVRQLLTESVLLALPAAALAFAMSTVALDAVPRALLATIPASYGPYVHILPLQPDARVFMFIMLSSLSAAVLFGLVPALQSTRPSVVQAAKGNFDAAHRPSRLRDALVIAQVAGAAFLLISSSVLLRYSHRLDHVDPGVRTHDVLQLGLVGDARTRALRRVRELPGVDAIASTSRSPLDGSFSAVPISTNGGREEVVAFFSVVSSGYFSLLEIPIIEGRVFSREEEMARAPVAVVSQSTARRLWPGVTAIGQVVTVPGNPRFLYGGERPLAHELTVIGVARDAVSGALVLGTSRPTAYTPTAVDTSGARFIVRVHGNVEHMRRAMDADLERAVPGSVDEIHSFDEVLAASLYGLQVAYWISSAIAAIALVLTLTGAYGVLSYLVTQRSREIGIRIALGATGRGVRALVLGQSLRLGLIGLTVGATLALAAARIMAAALPFMQLFDAIAYEAGAAIVLGVCVLAAWVPSGRAARIDPARLLRND